MFYQKFLLKQLMLSAALLLMFVPQSIIAQENLPDIMSSELERNMEALKNQEVPPYYINYRVDDILSFYIKASFGDLIKSKETKERLLTTMVRVGNNELDNFHEIRESGGFGFYFPGGDRVYLPIENNENAIRQILWLQTDKKYKEATDKYAKVKANIAVKVEEEDKSSDFSIEKAYQYYEPPIEPEDIKFDTKKWEEKVKLYSKIFLDDPDILKGDAYIRYKVERKYFVSSEGGKIVQNMVYIRLFIRGSIKADDGMVLPLNKTYFAYSTDGLPDDLEVMNDVKKLVKKLKLLKDAPVVEPYAGPALLSGPASGVFFHEIFGHRIEGQRQKSVSDGQTFKKKVGEKVLPDHLSIIMDPTIDNYNGTDLNGFYKYDDEGILAQKVVVVKDGVLEQFLMSRCPIENFPNSNGHGRAEPGRQPVTRQSNLLVVTTNPLPMEKLRSMLIEETKKQNKEYAYLFQSVVGGFTMTGRYLPNSFNVTPTEVYRIYVDGRPDELVRGVDLVGTPLAMFSQIREVGDTPEVFTGTCGAESGRVPVTAISPAIFVEQIEMQKKSKSQEKSPILPRP
ncbi:MAG: TldD/PmbA family protein [Bacteroidales bacterium]|nr:TldD/PmbA family protein [Bacteroidales bacterium]